MEDRINIYNRVDFFSWFLSFHIIPQCKSRGKPSRSNNVRRIIILMMRQDELQHKNSKSSYANTNKGQIKRFHTDRFGTGSNAEPANVLTPAQANNLPPSHALAGLTVVPLVLFSYRTCTFAPSRHDILRGVFRAPIKGTRLSSVLAAAFPYLLIIMASFRAVARLSCASISPFLISLFSPISFSTTEWRSNCRNQLFPGGEYPSSSKGHLPTILRPRSASLPSQSTDVTIPRSISYPKLPPVAVSHSAQETHF